MTKKKEQNQKVNLSNINNDKAKRIHDRKRIEFILLQIYMIVMTGLTWYFSWNVIILSLLIMFLPGLYFTLKQGQVKKNLIETLAFSVPFGIMVEYACALNHAWVDNTILPFKLGGIASIDILIWGIFYTFFVVSFYKYFFDRLVSKKLSHNYIKYLLLLLVCLIVFNIIYYINPYFKIPYIYLQVCIVWFIILILTAYKNIDLFYRAIGIGFLFFPMSVFHEIVSLQLGHWYFEKGYHIGYLTLFEQYTFPFEELFWLIAVIPVMIILHEYFADNSK